MEGVGPLAYFKGISMTRGVFTLAAALVLSFCNLPGELRAGSGDLIVPQPVAARHGLTRTWVTQVQMDTARSQVAHVLLNQGMLFVQTDNAILHAIDGETGQTLWSEQVGRRGHLSMAPAANDNYVAAVNGSNLFVLNRFNGKLLWQTEVNGAPGAGPALSSERVYVPNTAGLIYAFRLKPVQDPSQELGKQIKETKSAERVAAEEAERRQSLRINQEYTAPLACQSAGRTLVQPLVTRQDDEAEYVVWPTDRGYMFVGAVNRVDENRFVLRYRLKTNGDIVAAPAYLPPDPKLAGDSGVIFAVSKDGFVHAIREKDGNSLWRFSTGEPLVQAAAVIGQHVYVPVQTGGMYAIEARTGKQVWWTPQVTQFVAASKDRLYAADRMGRLLILDAKTGARLDVLAETGPLVKIGNYETDRVYLVTQSGMIQCLHETELSSPIHHVVPASKSLPAPGEQPAKAPEKKVTKKSGEGGAKPVAKKPKTDDGLFGDEPAPKAKKKPKSAEGDAAAGDDPFGAAAKPKAGSKKKKKDAAEDDPFGAGGAGAGTKKAKPKKGALN